MGWHGANEKAMLRMTSLVLPQVPEYTIAPCMAMWIGVWREVPSDADTWKLGVTPGLWGGGWWEVSQRLQPVCPGTRGGPLE